MLCLWGKYTATERRTTCTACNGVPKPVYGRCNRWRIHDNGTGDHDCCSLPGREGICSDTIGAYGTRCITNYDGYYTGSYQSQVCWGCNGALTIPTGVYIPGTYLTSVTAEANTYPQNGRHSDGFWYVYQGLANKAPTISGTDTDLGTVTELLHKYSINDTDPSDVITVTERLDGVQLRTFTATREVEYTINPTWVEILNGAHKLTITATDNVGASTVRTISFSKAEYELEFTLQTPLAADDLVTKTIMSITRQLPTGALMQIYVCNNGFDEAPTWEDITAKVEQGEKFFFANTVKTADKWGYNLRICVQRLGAEGDCFIGSVGGNYE